MDLRSEAIKEIIERWNKASVSEREESYLEYLEDIEEILDEEITPVCIPKGYKQIAVRNDRHGINVVFYNPDEHLYISVINGKQAGPYTKDEIDQLRHNYNDVIEMKGKYLYITEVFDVEKSEIG